MNDLPVVNLKLQVLDALAFECGKENGPQKFLENVTVIRNVLICLRSNSKETPLLCEKVIAISFYAS